MVLIAACLALTMALVTNTQHRIHPDEFDHVAAARFYVEHWLPPMVADPRTLDSYSYAGGSYLNEWDIVYLLAGKFAFLVQPLVNNEVITFRLFNLLLFALLISKAWAGQDRTLVLATALLSSQIWYVFSYFNADAFPLFLCFLAAFELVSTSSSFNDRSRDIMARYLRLGIYVGLLILSKRTFWVFAMFTCVYMALTDLWHARKNGLYPEIRQIGTFALIVCALALPRIGYDIYLNGLPAQKTQKIAETAELLADHDFKPCRAESTIGMGLRNRGVGLLDMLHWTKGRFYWFKESLSTTFGVYHYLTVRGPGWLYVASAGVVMLLAAAISIAITFRGDTHDKILLSWAIACCMVMVALSIYHSWANDFQPQGRYLFAFFPILGILLIKNRRLVSSSLISALIGCGFLVSSSSFIFVGLHHMPKYWDELQDATHPVLKLERDWKRSR